MFNKKPPSDQLNQSQSLQNVQITNAAVQLSQAGRDTISIQSADLTQQQTGMNAAAVVQLLEELAAAVRAASLPASQQKKALAYLEPAKLEAAEATPDRESIAQNLKKVRGKLLILGDPGAGKTTTLLTLALEIDSGLCRRGPLGRFIGYKAASYPSLE